MITMSNFEDSLLDVDFNDPGDPDFDDPGEEDVLSVSEYVDLIPFLREAGFSSLADAFEKTIQAQTENPNDANITTGDSNGEAV